MWIRGWARSVADPKLIERVLKLYALASGTNFAPEATTARAMAEALIAKHNISLPSSKDRGAFAWANYVPHFKGAKWEFMLAECAAKLCGCSAFFDTEEQLTVFALVGTAADVQACQYLLTILHEQRMRDWLAVKSKGSGDSFYSFCFSFARGVEQKMERRGPDEIERTSQAWLWWQQQCGGIKITDLGIRGRGRSEAGRGAGEAASLHRGTVGGGGGTKRIAGESK